SAARTSTSSGGTRVRSRPTTFVGRSSIRTGSPRPSRAAALCCPAHVSSTASDVGKYVPALASSLRPTAQDELAVWGGPRLVRGKRVLDLGCGDGRLALGVAALARTVAGLDPDPEGIAAGRKGARDGGADKARFEA